MHYSILLVSLAAASALVFAWHGAVLQSWADACCCLHRCHIQTTGWLPAAFDAIASDSLGSDSVVTAPTTWGLDALQPLKYWCHRPRGYSSPVASFMQQHDDITSASKVLIKHLDIMQVYL